MSALPPIVPPFALETARLKVRAAENAWNTRDPNRVALAYTEDTVWRNRAEFPKGRDEVRAFLRRKWSRELEYRLVKELWSFTEDRIAGRFQYEWHDDSGQWFRSYGNELWEFDAAGLMRRREASINDRPIRSAERQFHWPAPGPRPDDHPGLTGVE
ncbi:nuclear transport factor 2 family protein [Gemmata sp. JC673]|uniref:Nuclear transport factor 2 family protein n=1 Tax=Gemmata algarum TaxID=2975278 RepID=A0ABU5F6R9_9BACT|nr:nuclear transport factor 2 family protein [Gemmata algarum]MDY3563184.1 nuclear transport factor 2 family protein [Gemmata algarum]